MVECKRLIIPIFFDVEPRDVRHQSGPFAPAFTRYGENDITNKEEVRKWRNALTEAGKVSGYTLANTCVNEATEIRNIVMRILTEVNRAPLWIGATHPIGLDSRIAELVEVMEVEAQNDVKMVGIHGMGGIGKTTLARAVYNQLFLHFDGCSFISDVREKAKQSKLISLQEQMLREVLNDKKVKVNDTTHGTGMIMDRIKRKKVLLVLDDVDSESQLEALVGSVDQFRPGSRIIITTRDMQVLIEPPTLRVKNVYEIKVLDSAQSLQLFSWHAFGTKEPPAELAKLSQEVAATAAGLPLALKIFGRHFLCQKTNKQREAMLKKLKKNPDESIHESLKISFDALNKEEKIVFLDIACFFIGEQSSCATPMWEERKLFPDLTIQVLMHKCLVNINKDTGKFEMHDSIRDMGRKIVEEENPSDPGMRSRLWNKDDILDVLQNKKVFGQLKVLDLSFCKNLTICPDFTCMPYIEKLDFNHCEMLTELHPNIGHLKSLTHLYLWGCESLKELPQGVWLLTSLVELDVSECYQITALPSLLMDSKSLKQPLLGKLKVMKLNSCKNLIRCPDFTRMPNIEELNFCECQYLTKLHPSIGHLKSLTRLNLSWCWSLVGMELPEGVWQLTSLEVLDLKYCSEITTLSSQLGNSGQLKQLFLDGTSITGLPESMRQLKQLNRLSLKECHSLKEIPEWIHSYSSLEELEAFECLCLASLPNALGNLRSLRNLDLRWTAIKELPCSFTSLEKLDSLLLTGCKRLKFLPPLPPSLTILDAENCFELEVIADVSNAKKLQEMNLSDCDNLVDVVGIEQLRHLKTLKLGGCRSLSDSLKARVEEANLHILEGFTFPGSIGESSDASAESSDA